MAKFRGKVGIATTTETAPGVWEEVVREVWYSGDLLRDYRRYDQQTAVNDELAMSGLVRIIADQVLYDNLMGVRYINLIGVNWKVIGVEVSRPGIQFTLGGVYNGPTP